MRNHALQPAAHEPTRFAVEVEDDAGARHSIWIAWHDLDDPASFASAATTLIGQRCSPGEWAGDAGGWQAHLGQLLARNSARGPLMNAPIAMDRPAFSDTRRESLLGMTCLGQVTMASERTPVPPPSPKIREEDAIERIRRKDAEEARERRRRLAPFLQLTRIGRIFCPNSGFYVAQESAWLPTLPQYFQQGYRHYVIDGRNGYVELLARSFAWREWLWDHGQRGDVVISGLVVGQGGGVA